jgi:hypothetical protein
MRFFVVRFFLFENKSIKSPMHAYGILASILVALLLTFIFSTSFRHRGPMGGLLFFFLVIFLASWASHLWIAPFGPVFFGVALVPLIFVAVLVAVLLLAAGASAIDRAPVDPPREKTTTEERSIMAIGFFFWLLVIILIAAIAIGYWVVPGQPVPPLEPIPPLTVYTQILFS